MLLRRQTTGEAPLALVFAGIAAFTVLSVMVHGLLHRSPDKANPSRPSRYLQSLEGVMNRYGQRGSSNPSSHSGGDSLAGYSGSAAGPGADPSNRALHKELLASLASGDILIRRLDSASGDYVYSRSRGWMKFDPQSVSFQPVQWVDLPQDFKDRYPKEVFGDGGQGGGSREGSARYAGRGSGGELGGESGGASGTGEGGRGYRGSGSGESGGGGGYAGTGSGYAGTGGGSTGSGGSRFGERGSSGGSGSQAGGSIFASSGGERGADSSYNIRSSGGTGGNRGMGPFGYAVGVPDPSAGSGSGGAGSDKEDDDTPSGVVAYRTTPRLNTGTSR